MDLGWRTLSRCSPISDTDRPQFERGNASETRDVNDHEQEQLLDC